MTPDASSSSRMSDPPVTVSRFVAVIISIAVGIAYYFSNPEPNYFYNYTFRIADRLLVPAVGLIEEPPPWLNEFVPFEGYYYSVFPLGSVVTMLPAAGAFRLGLINDMPAGFLAAFCAAVACLFFLLIARHYPVGKLRTLLMTSGFIFGTWTWTNLTLGGAWQLALGFALVGGLGSIYFSVFNRRPFLAGVFFALAFGNRTEVLLTAPILMYLLIRQSGEGDETKITTRTAYFDRKWIVAAFRRLALFCSVPFLLGVATLIYNYIRFHSFTDFGYARIPGVLEEPWYQHGIFSVRYIPGQLWEMFMKPWEYHQSTPYLMPNGFSSSVLMSSPFILFAARFGSRDRVLKYLSWLAILLMCVILWMHGNSGGWQFGYRYAMVCLPWLFVIMLESSPRKISPLEWLAYGFSIAVNAYATWLFHWSGYLRPW